MRSYSKIVLTAWLGSGAIQGQPGDEIAVTDENRQDVAELVKDRGCRVVYDGAPAKPVPAAGDEDSEAEGDGLSAVDDADSVDALEVAPRYIQALKDAGLLTIADVKAHGDLAGIPGITPAAAKKIAAELE
jgi:hypothetical protein